MFYNPPENVIRKVAFGKETVDMRITFQGFVENVQYADKAGDEVSVFPLGTTLYLGQSSLGRQGMSGSVLLWRAPVFFPENPVKEAAVVVAYGLHDAVCGEGGLGQQIYSLLQFLLL